MRAESLRHRIGRTLVRAFLPVFAISASGCPFLLPTPGAQHGAPSSEVVHKIEPGVTTRADILMMLGDPDHRADEDRYFVYDWSETRAVIGIIVAAGYQAFPIGAGLGVRNALALEFGPDGRVTRIKTFARDMEGLQDVGREHATTERLLWEDIQAWMKAVDEETPEGVK